MDSWWRYKRFFLKKKINDFDFVYDINPIELVDILKTNELSLLAHISILE